MTMINKKSAAFLAALDDNLAVTPRHVPSPDIAATPEPAPEPQPPRVVKPANSRAGLKHIGGYFDREDVEKVAVLRARLGLDNSELLQLAINELYKRHNAQRAFGDAR